MPEPMEKVSIYLWMKSLKQKAIKVIWDDHVPPFNTGWNARILLKSKEVSNFHTSRTLTLAAVQSASVVSPLSIVYE